MREPRKYVYRASKVTKVGNSLGITLPPSLLETLDLEHGDEVTPVIENGELKIET